MGKKRCADKEDLPLWEEDDLIQKIIVLLPVVSLLRCKLVCKSWCAPIQTSSFIDLYFNSSSSSKFGSFILHAAVDFERFRENALLMLSSPVSSESECVSRSGSWYSGSFGSWSTTAFYGICGWCDSGSGGLQWSTNNSLCDCCKNRKWKPATDNYYLGGGGGSNNDDDDDDDQQQLVLKLDNLGFPSCYQFGKMIKPPIVMVGSCNGLICLYDEQLNEVSLWNPATRQFRILCKPSSPITAGDGNVHRLFAFGFDAETKDYKVVLLSVFNRRMLNYVIGGPVAMNCICEVQEYSLSTDSWRLLEGITCLPGSPFPYPPDSSSELFYLNGSCFFMAKLLYSEHCTPVPKMQDRFIISLDLTKETITPIQLPSHHYLHHLYLCYLGKKIACVAKNSIYTEVYDVNDPTGSWEGFHISVFNEHKSSWTEVHLLRIRLGLPGERNIPRGISNDGVFALLETEIHGGLGHKKKKKMKLYNLVTNEVKKIVLSCDQVLSKAYAYNPSLVSIIGEAAAAAVADDMVIGEAAAAEMDWK